MLKERIEIRKEIFSSDLPHVEGKIANNFALIERSNPTTVTVFYANLRGERDDHGTLRSRNYSPSFAGPHAGEVFDYLTSNPGSKLQVKYGNGHKRELGETRLGISSEHLKSLQSDVLPEHLVNVDLSEEFTPEAVRIASRKHYALKSITQEDERLTIDKSRHYFSIVGDASDTASVLYLGNLGPRIELKGSDKSDLDRTVDTLTLDRNGFTLPNSSLELRMEHLLKKAIPKSSYEGFPELEVKFNVDPSTVLRHTYSQDDVYKRLSLPIINKIASSPDLSLILPYPHGMSRARRYHVCLMDDKGAEGTVVETMAGRVSSKIKSNSQKDGVVLSRDTQASHTTNTSGSTLSAEEYINSQGWTKINQFDKYQTKIPFTLKNGCSYLVSVDDCRDPNGNKLLQVELEFIGTTTGDKPRTVEQVKSEMTYLSQVLLGSSVGSLLIPSSDSKHGYFASRENEKIIIGSN